MMLFDENGIGRFGESIRGTLVVPDRPATCEPTEHPAQAEFPGSNPVRKFGFVNSRRLTATRRTFRKGGG